MRGRPQLIEELLEVLEGAGYEHGAAVVTLQVLTEYLGGRQVYWPRCVDGSTEARDAKIARDKRAGMSMADLVRKYGLSEQSVYNALLRYGHGDRRV